MMISIVVVALKLLVVALKLLIAAPFWVGAVIGMEWLGLHATLAFLIPTIVILFLLFGIAPTLDRWCLWRHDQSLRRQIKKGARYQEIYERTGFRYVGHKDYSNYVGHKDY